VGDVTSGGVFAFFYQLYLALAANQICQYFGSSLFWKLGYHPKL